MGRHVRKRKCKNCNDYFQPDQRSGRRQKFCAKSACRKASKVESQRRWLQKPQNRDYFKGPINVARVQRWRQSHPGYWRKPPPTKDALQDSLSVKTLENRPVAGPLVKDALQDVLSAQPLVLLGLIAQLTGSALQDDIAESARRLRQLGNDVLNRQSPIKAFGDMFSQTGGSYDQLPNVLSDQGPGKRGLNSLTDCRETQS